MRTAQLALAALPLLILLFLLMPRIGPLWSIPSQGSGRTGLSDQMRTGSFSRLVQDPAPALRITYLEGGPPPAAGRYWRVLVLTRFDGRTWSAGPLQQTQPRRRLEGIRGMPQQIWVAEAAAVDALPWPGEGQPSDPNLRINRDGVLLSDQRGDTRRRYGLLNSNNLTPWQKQLPQTGDLLFPQGANPRLEAIGRSWADTLAPSQRVQAARTLMISQGLRYTVAPPSLPAEAPLDALLFKTRAGFCEHFASSFTALMRAADVPARVVIGYQGGEWVPPDRWGPGFLDVRQHNAHAWSEVWLEPHGWLRVDPTAWLSPERIETGGVNPAKPLPRWLQQLERSWTKLDLAWSRWVVAFDANSQEQLLGEWKPWQGFVLMGGVALLIAPALWWLQRTTQRTQQCRHRIRLERCLIALRQVGLEPQPGESLEAFCQRAAAHQPSLSDPLHLLAQQYSALRYGLPSSRRQRGHALRQVERQLIHHLRNIRQQPVKQTKRLHG